MLEIWLGAISNFVLLQLRRRDSAEVANRIMTAEDITQQDLVVSKLLRQDIEKYKSLFPHVSAAIQLSNSNSTDGRYPAKGDTINYIYTNTQHKNPLCRIAALETAPSSHMVLITNLLLLLFKQYYLKDSA